MKSKVKSVLLYIFLALMWCGMLFCYAVVIMLSDIIKYFGNGVLPVSFVLITFICFIMPFIFRKKTKLCLPVRFIVFSLLSVVINVTTFLGAYFYLSHYTNVKWESYPYLRYCMVDSLERQHKIIGTTEQEVVELLGEPGNIANDYSYRYEYFIGYGIIDPHTYDIIFEDGIAVKTEINDH